MFAEQVRAAVDGARTLETLEPIARALWQGFSAGAVTEEDTEALSRLVEARKAVLRGDGASKAMKAVSGPTAARRVASYNRGQSFERRRRLAASGPLPPTLAAKFTVGELATLRIVRDEAGTNGSCDRTLGEIAARAGVSITTARNAIRLAARLGLLNIEERRVAYDRNLPNLLTITSPEWLAWMSRGPKARLERGWVQKYEANSQNKGLRNSAGCQNRHWQSPKSQSKYDFPDDLHL